MKSELSGIIKYVNTFYKPIKVDVDSLINGETLIIFYFNEIDDSYITNPFSNNIRINKEKNLELEIRNEIFNYFGIKTSGVQLDGYAPYRNHGLTINVELIN